MGGEVLSPRMKMISMMYLVLTALLAMNVSKDMSFGSEEREETIGIK